MKVIVAGENEKVVGIHVIGMGADEMMQGFGVAMKVRITKCVVGLDGCYFNLFECCPSRICVKRLNTPIKPFVLQMMRQRYRSWLASLDA